MISAHAVCVSRAGSGVVGKAVNCLLCQCVFCGGVCFLGLKRLIFQKTTEMTFLPLPTPHPPSSFPAPHPPRSLWATPSSLCVTISGKLCILRLCTSSNLVWLAQNWAGSFSSSFQSVCVTALVECEVTCRAYISSQ